MSSSARLPLPSLASPLLAVLLASLLTSGCVTHVRERCPSCAVVDGEARRLPPVRPGTERLFVIVPGVLGYGWEWDEAVRALRTADKTAFVVFWWEPWGSVRRASDDLRSALTAALYWTPSSVREVVVVAHSVGGLVAAHAIGGLQVPNDRHVELITVGAPFAGMLGPPFSWDDALRSPAMMSVMGTFRDYPRPPPRVDIVEYVTTYPSDPVMQPRYGHLVAPPEVGPRGARRIAVDPKFDHNQVVSRVLIGVLRDHAPPETIAP